MSDFFLKIFDTNGFPPRWNCGSWSSTHGWIHIISDLSIFAAYFAIPCVLIYFLYRRRDVPFPPIFWLFAGFILSCGIGHAIEATIFWHPWYRFSALVKVITAMVSWATVFALIPIIPKVLAIPGIAAMNKKLLAEIARREEAEAERRKLEAQVLQTQKLESLGLLAGGIAHDFNNILTGIMGYIDLARLELPPNSIARQLMEEAAKNTQRAADLTKQMLAYSGKGRFVIQPLNLSEVVKEALPLLEISISKKVTLNHNLAPNLPNCEADRTQIDQVLMNLVINASEAMEKQSGVIQISTGMIYCSQEYLKEAYLDESLPAGNYVYLEVMDTGSGMSEATRVKIFDPFFTTKFTGRGLGLAAVLGIVRGHRGAIKVISELGKGTTFRVLFPATNKGISQEVTVHSPSQSKIGSGTVLVVDDEEVVRNLATGMLQRMGFHVLTAKDGADAIEVFRHNADRIRLVLLDLLMPNLDGAETLKELRLIRPEIRILLSSGYNEELAKQEFTTSRLTGFVQKPYNYEQLFNAIKQALDKSSS